MEVRGLRPRDIIQYSPFILHYSLKLTAGERKKEAPPLLFGKASWFKTDSAECAAGGDVVV